MPDKLSGVARHFAFWPCLSKKDVQPISICLYKAFFLIGVMRFWLFYIKKYFFICGYDKKTRVFENLPISWKNIVFSKPWFWVDIRVWFSTVCLIRWTHWRILVLNLVCGCTNAPNTQGVSGFRTPSSNFSGNVTWLTQWKTPFLVCYHLWEHGNRFQVFRNMFIGRATQMA